MPLLHDCRCRPRRMIHRGDSYLSNARTVTSFVIILFSLVHLWSSFVYRSRWSLPWVTAKIPHVRNLRRVKSWFGCFAVRSIVIVFSVYFIWMLTMSITKKRRNKTTWSWQNCRTRWHSINRSSNNRFKPIENLFIKLRPFSCTTPRRSFPSNRFALFWRTFKKPSHFCNTKKVCSSSFRSVFFTPEMFVVIIKNESTLDITEPESEKLDMNLLKDLPAIKKEPSQWFVFTSLVQRRRTFCFQMKPLQKSSCALNASIVTKSNVQHQREKDFIKKIAISV